MSTKTATASERWRLATSACFDARNPDRGGRADRSTHGNSLRPPGPRDPLFQQTRPTERPRVTSSASTRATQLDEVQIATSITEFRTARSEKTPLTESFSHLGTRARKM
ncbi:hypothetical protein HKX48_000739, partial [Thoreauomyces humboldtii]